MERVPYNDPDFVIDNSTSKARVSNYIRGSNRDIYLSGTGWGHFGTSEGDVEFQDYDHPFHIDVSLSTYGNQWHYNIGHSWEEITTLSGQRSVIRDNAAIDGGPYPVMLVYQGQLASSVQWNTANAPYGSWKYKGIRSLDGSVVITEPEETVYAGEAEEFTGYAFVDFSVSAALAGYVPTSRNINANLPLTGGGDLSGDLTLALGSLNGWGTANQIPGMNAAATDFEYKTITAGTNISVTHGVGTVTIAVAATLGATIGGTGQTTVTTGDLLYGSAANTWSKLSAGTSGYVLTSGGAGVAPSWQAVSAGAGVTGSGTTGKLPKWSSSSALTDSVLVESSSLIGVNCTPTAARLHVQETGSTTVGVTALKISNIHNLNQSLLALEFNNEAAAYVGRALIVGRTEALGTTQSLAIYVGGATPTRHILFNGNTGAITVDAPAAFSGLATFNANIKLSTNLDIVSGFAGSGELPAGCYLQPLTESNFVASLASNTNAGSGWVIGYYNGGYKSAVEILASATPNLKLMKSGGVVGIGMGSTTPARALEVRSTSAQVRGSYDATNYWEIGCDVNGNLAITGAGTASTSIQIGRASGTPGAATTILGTSATCAGTSCVIIGRLATGPSTAESSVAVGLSANTGDNNGAICIGADSSNTGSNSVAIGRSATAAANEFVSGNVTYSISNVYFGSGKTAATPVSYTLNGSGGSGTNIAGGGLKLAGGKPTGSGAGGSVILQTAPAGASGTTLRTLADRLTIDQLGNIYPGTAALATSATDGFIYLQSCAGAPSGAPTAFTGRVATVIDTTNGRLYAYYGAAWHYLTFT